jgi:hypothetical protein
MRNEALRELRAGELESVSGGDGAGGIPGGILGIGQGMYELFDGWNGPAQQSTSTAGMPLCGGAVKAPACLLP